MNTRSDPADTWIPAPPQRPGGPATDVRRGRRGDEQELVPHLSLLPLVSRRRPWTSFQESPGQGLIFSTTYSSSLSPQVSYNTGTGVTSQLTNSLSQGVGQWSGTGTPPAAAAQVYSFQNLGKGVQLYYSPTAAPSAPKLTATATSTTQASLSWSGTANAAGYVIDEWINNAWSQIGTMSAGSTGCTVNGLSPNTKYYFAVGAFNVGGTTWSSSQSVTTAAAESGGHHRARRRDGLQPRHRHPLRLRGAVVPGHPPG